MESAPPVLIPNALALAALYLVFGLATLTARWIVENAHVKTHIALARDYLSKLFALNDAKYRDYSSADLLRLYRRGIKGFIRLFFSNLPPLVATVNSIAIIVGLFFVDATLTGLTLGLAAALVMVSAIIVRHSKSVTRRVETNLHAMYGFLSDFYRAITDISGIGVNRRFAAKFYSNNHELSRYEGMEIRLHAVAASLMQLFVLSLPAVVLLFLDQTESQAVELAQFYSLFILLVGNLSFALPFSQAAGKLHEYVKLVSEHKWLIAPYPEVAPDIHSVSYGPVLGSGYPTIGARDEVKIRRGEFIVILGESGAGKSTFLKLVSQRIMNNSCRYSDASNRNIHAGGQTSLAAQMPYLEYSRFGIGYTIGEWLSALGVDDDSILLDWPLLSTKSKEFHIDKLSDGEKASLLILSMLHRSPPSFLLIDELFANTDDSTERDLINIIRKKVPLMSILYTTNKISTAKYADRILLIHKMEIKGSMRGSDFDPERVGHYV